MSRLKARAKTREDASSEVSITSIRVGNFNQDLSEDISELMVCWMQHYRGVGVNLYLVGAELFSSFIPDGRIELLRTAFFKRSTPDEIKVIEHYLSSFFFARLGSGKNSQPSASRTTARKTTPNTMKNATLLIEVRRRSMAVSTALATAHS
jgi:hypothetical protein